MTQTQFSQLKLDPRIEKAVEAMGFDAATPIQAQVIPLIRAGADVIAKSQTGTGKTAAFGIPALESIDTAEEKPTIQALILCPTRELAQQAGDGVARALAEGEADGLDDGHQGEGHAYGGGGAGTDLPYEVGIGHVVDRGDQHADDGGDSQRGHQVGDGGLGHLGKFVFGRMKDGQRCHSQRMRMIQYSIV